MAEAEMPNAPSVPIQLCAEKPLLAIDGWYFQFHSFWSGESIVFNGRIDKCIRAARNKWTRK